MRLNASLMRKTELKRSALVSFPIVVDEFPVIAIRTAQADVPIYSYTA